MVIPNDIEELKRGYARYRTVRILKPNEFAMLWRRSLETGVKFDDLIDELIDGIPRS